MSAIEVFYIELGCQDTDGWEPCPDSAGGVSVKFSFINKDPKKVIKYARFYFTPINRVGDAVNCLTRHISQNSVLYTGPLSPNQEEIGCLFENAWYNESIDTINLDRVDITYMDGTSVILEDSQIDSSVPPKMSELQALAKQYLEEKLQQEAEKEVEKIKAENESYIAGIIFTIIVLVVLFWYYSL